jgi:hypothetical protein
MEALGNRWKSGKLVYQSANLRLFGRSRASITKAVMEAQCFEPLGGNMTSPLAIEGGMAKEKCSVKPLIGSQSAQGTDAQPKLHLRMRSAQTSSGAHRCQGKMETGIERVRRRT